MLKQFQELSAGEGRRIDRTVLPKKAARGGSTTTTPPASLRPGQVQPVPRHPTGEERAPAAAPPPWKGRRSPCRRQPPPPAESGQGLPDPSPGPLQPPQPRWRGRRRGGGAGSPPGRKEEGVGAAADRHPVPPSRGGRPATPVTCVREVAAPPPPAPRGLWPATPSAAAREGGGGVRRRGQRR